MTLTSHDRVPAAIRCPHCDDTGDVHRADGEWLGTCACQSAPPTEPYLIWWTNQADCERIVPLDSWPTYLYDEYQSRIGRNGRGRLWVPRFLKTAPDGVSVPWDTANNWLCAAASDAAGIVIKAEHVEHVQFLPGFVTTFAMTCPSSHDAALLDTLRDESWDLRCFNMPTGGGDADIGWRVVGHWQAQPQERTVGEIYHDDPRAAIRNAIVKTSAQPTLSVSSGDANQRASFVGQPVEHGETPADRETDETHLNEPVANAQLTSGQVVNLDADAVSGRTVVETAQHPSLGNGERQDHAERLTPNDAARKGSRPCSKSESET